MYSRAIQTSGGRRLATTTISELEIQDGVHDILEFLAGTDSLPDDAWENTPRRTVSWLKEYQHDKSTTLDEILQPRFPELHGELVLVRNINFSALCAHHLLPFLGKAHIGYIPNKEVVGLSKFVRAVQWVAQRVTLQEHITEQLASGIFESLKPQGIMVVLEAEHLCMKVRGVRDPHVDTVTTGVRGEIKREEMLSLLMR